MNKYEANSIEKFNNWAKFYDKYFSIPFRMANGKIKEMIEVANSERVLDIGCGTGILLKLLKDGNQNYELHGIDVSPKMIDVSKKKLGGRINLVVGSSENLPYENCYFDVVSCCT